MSLAVSAEIIESYGDLARNPDISGRDVDIVAGQIADAEPGDDSWVICHVPTWLLEEKREETGIQPVAGSDTIVAGGIEAETDKAFLVEADGGEAWLPKSVITVFEPAEDAEIDIPQRGLSDFAPGGDA